jgi:7-keto-8-aminopelargonate synthetase-like enzyme
LLAAWFGTEGAIVYPSGYLANLGTLGALLSSQDAVFVDRLAHASLFDAAWATRATLRVFHHNDAAHTAALLARTTRARRRLIVTEGLFSMDGDYSPLAEFVEVAQAYDAMVYVDDAHGAFVLGETGRGTPEAAGVSHERLLYMGALGKGLGCQGGFVVGPRTLTDFLHNRARTFIYTTALAVPVAAAAVAALRLLNEEPQRRELLRERVARLRERLASFHLPAPPALLRGAKQSEADGAQAGGMPLSVTSHIVPVVVGQTQQTLDLARQLWDRGVWAPAIRPPTVPEGAARLRLSITSLHTDAHINALAHALQETLSNTWNVHSP